MEKRQITRQELVAAALKLGARPGAIRQWFHRGIPYRWQIRLMEYFEGPVEIRDWAPEGRRARPRRWNGHLPHAAQAREIRRGHAMRCLRISNKVLRWYTECCRTPIANTPAGPVFPVIGMAHSFMDHEAGGRSRDEVLGPPLCRIFERSAVGPLPPNAPGPPSVGLFAHRASKLLGWWVRGLSRPTPFFDDRAKAPRAVPRVLTQSERAALS